MLESELFGHVKGAYTGAVADRPGRFELAGKGTLFLDEIAEISMDLQAKLLRVLQERTYERVGDARPVPLEARVIAATHRDLSQMVARGTFREDLFYRLNVIEIRVPALRERSEDIPLLIDHFLRIFAARYNREKRSVSRDALKKLAAYGWPGNVRQLENVLLNAWILTDADELGPDDFELPSAQPVAFEARARTEAAHRDERPVADSEEAYSEQEREEILAALGSCNWNRAKAARLMDIPRRTFYRRLKKYGIQ